jgi:choline dehydrogenase-like flavoprotein
MGKDIYHGVVDSKLRVYGVQNLRVIDASVIPVIPDCRIQNSVYMIGEKVSARNARPFLRGAWSVLTHVQGADMIKAAYLELYA